jgi:hypothetical protein
VPGRSPLNRTPSATTTRGIVYDDGSHTGYNDL